MVTKAVNYALRGLQFLLTFLILALVGNMIHEAIAGNHSSINFTMFVAVFSLLSLFYLIATTVRESLAKPAMLPSLLDLVNTLLFLIAAIVLSAKLGVHSCGNDSYVNSNSITNGGRNNRKRCHEAQAAAAFLWFGFIAYLASTIFSGLAAKRTGVSTGGIRKGPAMSNV